MSGAATRKHQPSYPWPSLSQVCGATIPDFYGKTCNTTTGRPWVLCDGHDNEQTRDYSSKNSMQLMSWDVTELALLYWYEGDESYAERAAVLV